MAQGTADIDIPTITVYLPAANPTKTAVVIAPGGGYAHLSMQKEGEDIALWLNAHGVAGIVLKYRLGPKYHNPVELNDAKRAIRTVRSEAAQARHRARPHRHLGLLRRGPSGGLPRAPFTTPASPPPPTPSTSFPAAPTS